MSPADKPVRIGMLGCGVVGSSVARLLLADTAELSTRAGVKIELSRIAVRTIKPYEGINPALFTTDPFSIVNDPEIDLIIEVKGDLYIDEHHTIEDVGIALGDVFSQALGSKKGINRYGFLLPMDDCLAQVAIDFGGRSWIVWDAEFKREKIGEMPSEMFFHFFKSFSDAAKCNLNIKAEGENEHHKIESIFKAFAKAIKMAARRDINNNELPSTKGIL